MISLKHTFEEAARHALKNKEPFLLQTLRLALAALHNREIEKRGKTGSNELAEEEIVAVLRAEAKKRRDAAAEFEKGGRKDLSEKELREAAILEKYLPVQLPDEEIEKIVREVIGQSGGATPKNFGTIMGETMKRLRGQASGERVKDIVDRLLKG